MVSSKGKGKGMVTDDGGKGKRKWSGGGRDDDKTGRKRKNPGTIQFSDDEARQVDSDKENFYSDSSGSGNESEDLEDEPDTANKEPGKASYSHDVKEEVKSEEKFDRTMEDKYRPGSGLVTNAEDGHDHENSIDRDIYVPSAKDATILKVKCAGGGVCAKKTAIPAQRDGDNGGSSSWNQPKDNASSSVNAEIQGDTGGRGWGKPSASKETSWNQPKDNVSSQGWGSSWNQSKGDDNSSSSVYAQIQGDTGCSGWGNNPSNPSVEAELQRLIEALQEEVERERRLQEMTA